MDALPDFASLSDDDLSLLIRQAEEEEEAISVRRRSIHARIDLLRGARVERLRNQVENGTLDLPAPSALERPIFEGTGDPPEEHVQDCIEYLKRKFAATVETRTVREEDVSFPLPRELRVLA